MCTFCRTAIGSNTAYAGPDKKKSELIPLYKPLNLPMERPEARLYAPCCVCDVLFPRGNIINDLINEELALVLVTKSSSLRARTTMFVVRTTTQLPHFYLLPVPFLSPPTPPKLLLLQELPQTYTYKHTPHIYQNTQYSFKQKHLLWNFFINIFLTFLLKELILQRTSCRICL